MYPALPPLPDRPQISRTRVGEEAARYLRDSLMGGRYAVGERVGIEELAREIGVSTMPVREALLTMANEGLLEALPYKGFRVAGVSRQDFVDIFMVHATIAGTLAERAAAGAGPELLDTLRTIQDEVNAANRRREDRARVSARVEELNFQFHRHINQVTDSNRLRWFLRSATRFIPRHFYNAIPGWIDATVEDHPPLIQAFADRDGYLAGRLMTEHVLKAGRLVVNHLDSGQFWAGFEMAKPKARYFPLKNPAAQSRSGERK